MATKLLTCKELEYRSVDVYDFQLYSEDWKEKGIENIVSFSITADEYAEFVDEYAPQLENVQHLILGASSSCEETLTKIPEAIKHFKKLQILTIYAEHIEQIPDIFEHFLHLKRLTIKCDEEAIALLPSSLYKHLKKLEFLYLENIQQIAFEEICSHLTSLRSLSIIKCNLSEIPAQIQNLSKLQRLYFAQNSIEQIPSEIGRLKRLVSLVIEENKIKYIPESLANLQSLNSIDLSKNQIVEVPSFILQGFPKLKILALSGNQITQLTFENSEVPKQSNLVEVYLGDNQLQEFPSFLLTDCPQLKELYLQRNQIKNIPEITLEKNKITRIQLNNNALQVFPQTLFKQLHKIRFFHLNNNQIRLLPNDLLSLAKSKKTSVLLENNQITHFSEEIIQYLKEDNIYGAALELGGNPAFTLFKKAQNEAYQARIKAQEENKTCMWIGDDTYRGSGVLPEEHPLYGRISFTTTCHKCKSKQILVTYASFSVHLHSGDVYWDYNYTCQACGHTDASSYAEND